MTAQPTTARKSSQVSATIAPEKLAALEDYRWENRVNKMSDVVSQAIDAFIAAKGLTVAAPAVEAEKAPEGKPTKA